MQRILYPAVCVSLFAIIYINPVKAQEVSNLSFYNDLEQHHQQCISFYKLQAFDEALEHGLLAINMSNEADYPSSNIVESFEYCGIVLRDYKKNHKEAIHHFNKALLIYQIENNYPASARILSELALCYEQQHNYRVGLSYRLRSFNLTNDNAVNNEENTKRNYEAIVSDYRMLGNETESIRYQKLYKKYLKTLKN